jgi:molybdopterin/thiamine biosynthesis adenylyltransferase
MQKKQKQTNPVNDYLDRVDRNMGWLTKDEQLTLRESSISIAGCGGIGGYLAECFHRLGIGRLKLADNGIFDKSNLNRQSGADYRSLGKPKAKATADRLRSLHPDCLLEIYPNGITENEVKRFCQKTDAICDCVDFWSPGTRLLIHQEARNNLTPVYNSPAVGFGGFIFLFGQNGQSLEKHIDITLDQALDFENRYNRSAIQPDEKKAVAKKILNSLIPRIPSYSPDGQNAWDTAIILQDLFEQGKSSVLATTVPMVVGLAASRILLDILFRKNGQPRSIEPLPPFPSYCWIDAARLTIQTVIR